MAKEKRRRLIPTHDLKQAAIRKEFIAAFGLNEYKLILAKTKERENQFSSLRMKYDNILESYKR